MRLGVLTFHRAYNCGAMLQAWALKRVLEGMGHSVEFPACNHVGEGGRWVAKTNLNRHGWRRLGSAGKAFLKNVLSIPVEDVARARYRRFRERELPERACAPEELGKLYDALVVGSDQVWNEDRAKAWLPLFLGENWVEGTKAVAYGASWGDVLPDRARMARLATALGRFSGVSVRESYARDDLELAGAEKGRVGVVADPTLLADRADWERLAGETAIPRGPYLFMYNVMFESKEAMRVARAVARRLGLKPVVASVYQYTRWKAPRGLEWGMSPERLVAYTAGAACVLACSFHGTVMGLTFGKPTLSLLPEPDGGRSRSGELLRGIGEEWRLATPAESPEELARRLGRGGIPAAAAARMASMGEASRAWLRDRLADLEDGRGAR